jgi:8-oxo-dGTP pyrophosphatase MutT (NUDIX family)
LTDVPVREAATLALLRDTDAGLEVFMLQRSHAAVFSPSAHVFPGGALDEADRIGAADDAADDSAYRVAAIRESFEEAGLLLATTADGDVLRLDERDADARFALHRKTMIAGDRTLSEICDEEGLRLATDRLVPFGHWITPVGPPRRFDTRFFAARAPAYQQGVCDDIETIAGAWARPVDVLRQCEQGTIELILPTQRSLEKLADHHTVEDALRHLR